MKVVLNVWMEAKTFNTLLEQANKVTPTQCIYLYVGSPDFMNLPGLVPVQMKLEDARRVR